MEVSFRKSFQKDLKKVDSNIKKKLPSIISQIKNANSPEDITNLVKLKGTKEAYRIRIGDYRIGITISGQNVEIVRLLHRKDMYKYFP